MGEKKTFRGQQSKRFQNPCPSSSSNETLEISRLTSPLSMPRPLDIYKKLPVVKSVKDFEDDDTPTSATRNSQMLRLAAVKVETEEALEAHDGASKGKYTIGLGQDCMAFCTEVEDVISMSLTAVTSLLAK
ncbi:hypothetical protein E1A91_A12G017900v1 [Gossypium mustelinum]|uniref:Hydroxymethylglutaryl-coenzyme A synthase N-terminal domain-containing protein n=1 Tax=Gossypium mustelinum TaxID=34275 RepID=A0A5D2WNL6_GOSMU|nr:hypothetical protein E1A91_A12G017900v1 [Gossypium mustelinum]